MFERSFHSLQKTARTDYSGRSVHGRPAEEVSVYGDVLIFIFQQIDYQGNFIISLHSRTRSLLLFRLLLGHPAL